MNNANNIYVNQDTLDVVWQLRRNEESLLVVGTILTVQFLTALERGWNSRAYSRQIGSSQITVNIKPSEISTAEAQQLASISRAFAKFPAGSESDPVVAEWEEMIRFIERGGFEISKANAQQIAKKGDRLLVWRA